MKKGRRVLCALLCLALALGLGGAALAAPSEVEIVWLPEGVSPLDASRWSIQGGRQTAQREVKKGDLIAVGRDGEYGYMDLNGELVVPFTSTGWSVDYIYFYSDGLLPVFQYDEHHKLTGTNYVDKTGAVVIELTDGAQGFAFHDGIAVAEAKNSWGEMKWGAIDTKGNYVIPPEYDSVGIDAAMGVVNGILILGKKNEAGELRYGLVNTKGEALTPIEYTSIQQFTYSNGESQYTAWIDTYRAVTLDQSGKEVSYDHIYESREKLESDGYTIEASSKKYISIEKDGKHGFADENGKIVVPPEYDKSFFFSSDGFATVCKNGKYGLIDLKGNVVIPLEYDSVQYASGQAKLRKDEKWGFTDGKLKVVAPPQYDEIGGLYGGFVPVRLGEKWGFTDGKGNVAVPLEYDRVKTALGGLFPVCKDGKWGFLDQNGAIVLPLEYSSGEMDRYNNESQGTRLIMSGYIGVVYNGDTGRYGIFENPYYEESKAPSLLDGVLGGGTSAAPGTPGGDTVSPGSSSDSFPVLPVAVGGAAVAAAAGAAAVLLRKKRR